VKEDAVLTSEIPKEGKSEMPEMHNVAELFEWAEDKKDRCTGAEFPVFVKDEETVASDELKEYVTYDKENAKFLWSEGNYDGTTFEFQIKALGGSKAVYKKVKISNLCTGQLSVKDDSTVEIGAVIRGKAEFMTVTDYASLF